MNESGMNDMCLCASACVTKNAAKNKLGGRTLGGDKHEKAANENHKSANNK